MAEVFANDGQAVVSSGGTTAPAQGTVETWTLTASTLPVLSGSQFFYAADDNLAGESEKFLFTANNGTTATVTRGADGTTPVTHAPGFSVSQVIARATLQELMPLPSGTASAGQVPVATGSGSASAWGGVLANPMTTAGDLIAGGSGGAPQRLPAGSAGQVLTVSSGAPAWESSPGLQPSGDTSGATDAANLQALLNLGVKTVQLGAGQFYGNTTVTSVDANTYIDGAGNGATQWNFTGTGDAFHLYGTSVFSNPKTGAVRDLTIDGTSAGAGSCGLHYGDMRAFQVRLAVQNFSGAGSTGVHFDNQYNWTEETTGYLWLSNNTQNIVFDVSAPAGTTVAAGSNGGTISSVASWSSPSAGVLDVASAAGLPSSGTVTVAASGSTTAIITYTGISGNSFTGCAYVSGSATGTVATGGAVGLVTSTNSFGYTDLQVEILAKVGQDGVVLQNGAVLYNSRFTLKANFQGSASVQSNAVLRITGGLPFEHINAISSTAVASGSAGGEISAIASWSSPSAGVLDVVSTTGFAATGGTLNVAASGGTVAVITYGGISGSSFTGCAYVSGSATGTVATGGTVSAVAYSAVRACYLDVQAECGSALGTNAPQTIAFGNLSQNSLIGCIGIMDFAQGSLAFAVSNWTATGGIGAFGFDGVVLGDFNLNNATAGLSATYSFATAGPRIHGKSLLNTASGNLQVNYGDYFSSTLSGNITVNLNPSGAATLAGAQRKVILIQQAGSGGPYTVTWPSTGSPSVTNCTVIWPGGVTPVMSAGASATDVYVLETYNGATWYGQAYQASAAPAPLQAQPAGFAPSSPTATASTTQVMMGLGSTCTYTPSQSGKVLLTVTGTAKTSTAENTVTAGGRYGTGTAPTGSYTATATNASPCVFTAAGSAYANGTEVYLGATSSLPTGFTANTIYYVVSASGTTFSLATTFGGTAINSSSTGSGIYVGTVVTGTRFGPAADPVFEGAGAGAPGCLAITALLSLTPGTAYWFDLAVQTGSSADIATIAAVSMTMAELP